MSSWLTELLKYLKLKNTLCSAIIVVWEQNLFQCDWYIREQVKHNADFTFAYVQIPLLETPDVLRKQHPPESSCIGIHKTQDTHISNLY